jgi:nucleoside-diphosphate-sugar epimerase
VTGRYFITGAQGFVGRYVVAHLLMRDRDVEVFGIGRSPADDSHFTHPVHWGARALRAPLPPEITLGHDGRYRYEIADLANQSVLRTMLRAFRPGFILHMAAGLRDDPIEHLFRTNVEGSVHLIEALISAGISVQRVVFGSSGAIYGRSANTRLPLDEDTPCLPVDLYSVSKLASELVSRILTDRHGIPAVWARIFNIVGPGQDERHFCGKVAAQAAAIRSGLMPAKIEVGDLTPTRDFIDVRDVAAAIVLLAQRGKAGTAYNVASGVEATMARVLELAMELSELNGTVVENTYRRAADIPRAYANAARLMDLGFAPGYDLPRSMADLIDYYCTTVRSAAEIADL